MKNWLYTKEQVERFMLNHYVSHLIEQNYSYIEVFKKKESYRDFLYSYHIINRTYTQLQET